MPYPQMATFDAPDSLTPCTRRDRSTTPLQALTLLNDPVFFEAAQGLATRILREAPADLGPRVDYAFRLCLSRSPSSTEKERVIRYYNKQKQTIASDAASIERLYPPVGVEQIDRGEAAIWVNIASVLLNLDAFINRS
jgi:hypothetical protein